MVQFEFVIPLSKEDLRNANKSHQYVVQETFSKSVIAQKIKECHQQVKSNNAEFIINYFDALYCVLCDFTQVEDDVKEITWKIILKGMNLLEKYLCQILDSGESLDQHSCAKFRNMLKMCCYLLCQFIAAFESKIYQQSTKNLTGKGQKKAIQNDSSYWDKERLHGITALNTICQLKLHKLWEPPVVEEEFVNLIMNCCFKLLENQTVARCKATKNAIFNLLGISLKKYKNSLSCSLKIIQFVQHFDYLVTPLAQAVELFVKEYDINNIVNEIIREINQMDIQDLIRDNTGTRSLSQFLVEVAEKLPSTILNSASLLLHFLDEESYVMRCGVLSIFGEIIIKVLSNTELENKTKNLRDQMLDKLEEHIHDVNAFVRSKALQVWQNLCSEKAIPLDRQNSLLTLIIGRLMDKSSFVRKYAIQFINTIIQVNPYGGILGIEELQQTLKKEEECLKELLSDEPEENENMKIIKWETVKNHFISVIKDENEEDNGKDAIYQTLCKLQDSSNDQDLKTFFEYAIAQLSDFEIIMENNEKDIGENDDENMSNVVYFIENCYINYVEKKHKDNIGNFNKDERSTENKTKINKQQNLVQYFTNMLQFSKEIQEALPIICQLLHSTCTATDVLESIRFFVTAYQFGIKDAIVGVKNMLFHIWSKEDTIRDSVVSAYKELYLSHKNRNIRESTLNIVKNITLLVQGSTFAEEICLEKMIGEFMKSGDFNNNIIEMLWDQYLMKIPNTTIKESHSSLKLLRMAAIFDKSIVEKNIELLLSVGFDSENTQSFAFVCDVCKMLLQLANSSKDKSDKFYHFPNDDDMFKKIIDVLVKGIIKLDDHYWIPMAEQAINVIYKLAQRPDKLCSKIMEEFSHVIKDFNSNCFEDISKFPLTILQRIINFSGHVALQHLLYNETYIIPRMKKQIQQNNIPKGKRKSDNDLRVKSMDRNDTANESIPDEDVGMIELADEIEIENFRKTFEANAFNKENLFGIIYPLVIEICKNPNKYSDNYLQASCAITLGKFMMISSTFCDSNLQLLVTLMEKSSNSIVRGNTVIAFGDLAVRFPNIIEPWTTHIYNRLHDSCTDVKKKALIVLSHLILHDIIKVKQQISDVALCIVDKEDCIVQLTKTFFQELSKKGNAVYNILSDIISHLSDPEVGTTKENFQEVMKYLFQFIEKEKHVEALVEKLCYRFRATRNEEQWRNLAYCLSLLSYNERSLLKLQENLGCLGEKLIDNDVYDYMTSIYNGAKKNPNLKGKAKNIIEELEQQIEILHKNDGEEAVLSNQDNFKLKSFAKTPAKTPASRIKPKNISSCRTIKSSRRKKVKIPVLSFSSSESD